MAYLFFVEDARAHMRERCGVIYGGRHRTPVEICGKWVQGWLGYMHVRGCKGK